MIRALLFLTCACTLAACGGATDGPAPEQPTATLQADRTSVAAGDTVTLSWSSTEASACQASDGWDGVRATGGSEVTAPLTASTVFLLSCTGAGGTSNPASVTVNLVPTAQITALPARVTAGASATLTWSSTDATACVASGDWSGVQALSGMLTTGALAANVAGIYTYFLTCSGPGGSSTPASAGVMVVSAPPATAPTVSLVAAPVSLASGAASTLSWTSTDAASCSASGGWSGARALSGTEATPALSASTSFTLTCTGAGGSTSASAVVSVASSAPAPGVSIAATPASIANGASSTLTWSSTNASACTASGGWNGARAVSGTQASGALSATSTFILTCAGPGGSTSASALVTVAGALQVPGVSIAAAPANLASGASSTLTWSSTNATACSASGAWSGAQASSGTFTTGSLTANATYTLTCSGTGGSSAAASATVYVASRLAPRIAALPLNYALTFTQTLPAGGVSWSVDGIAGGSASAGTISSAGLYTSGTQVGSHTVLAISDADATQAQSAQAVITDLSGITTHHNNNARTGANVQEYALTPATVTAANFGRLAACAVDGAINAQPLWLANVSIGASRHNVVFVATQHDSVYAFDADSSGCLILWQASLLDAAHGAASGETSVPSGLVGVGSGDIQPEIGIASTPVLDAATGILYVVGKTIDSAQINFSTRLHALDVSTGSEKSLSPVTVSGSVVNGSATTINFDTSHELQRPGLALANGVVYLAFSAHEDAPPWYGWMFGYRYGAGGFTRTALLNTAPDASRAGIWMSGGAPAIDADNSLYVLTGNGTFTASSSVAPNSDYGDSFLKLSPALAVTQYWTPADEAADAAGDKDFGAGGAAVLADLPAGTNYTHIVMGGGKAGVLELLNRDSFGGFTGQTVQELALGHGLFATPAIWNSRIYVAGAGGPLQAWALASGSTVQFIAATPSVQIYAWPGATPTVSASGTQNGIVWAMETNAYCTRRSRSCGAVILHAYDATNLGLELWKSSTSAADTAGYAVKFTVPTVANGHVYVGTRGNNTGTAGSVAGELDIYGFKP